MPCNPQHTRLWCGGSCINHFHFPGPSWRGQVLLSHSTFLFQRRRLKDYRQCFQNPHFKCVVQLIFSTKFPTTSSKINLSAMGRKEVPCQVNTWLIGRSQGLLKKISGKVHEVLYWDHSMYSVHTCTSHFCMGVTQFNMVLEKESQFVLHSLKIIQNKSS